MYHQENEQTTCETVYVCKDETNNALLHETPNKLQSLAVRRCALNRSVAT